MRIRSTKPEFWRSKTIAQLDWDVRFVLKGLEAYVDDNGVGKNDIALIASDVFPRDLSARTSETLARLSEAISVLSEAGLIVQYEVDGEELLYIDKWKDVQRVDKPRPGRFRRPDSTIEYSEVVNRESYRNFQKTSEKVPPGTGDQRIRGSEERELVAQSENAPAPPDPEPSPEAARKRGRRLPENWRPSDSTTAWAKSKYGHLNLELEFEKFVNHWTAASGQNSRKCDWDAALKNWLHNARPSPHSMPTNGHAQPTAFARKTAHNAAVFESLGDPPNRPELMP